MSEFQTCGRATWNCLLHREKVVRVASHSYLPREIGGFGVMAFLNANSVVNIDIYFYIIHRKQQTSKYRASFYSELIM